VLEREGVRFLDDAAGPSQRLTSIELGRLLESTAEVHG
jgi:hypothetical protein